MEREMLLSEIEITNLRIKILENELEIGKDEKLLAVALKYYVKKFIELENLKSDRLVFLRKLRKMER